MSALEVHPLEAEERKPVHTIILDSSPLLLNSPGISTLLANSHVLVTTPAVLAEIKNEEARTRIDTLYRPFLQKRSPTPESVKVIREFARKTGDGAVLSATDVGVLALAYEIECERNGGDWRLRTAPGQKHLNGAPPRPTGTEDSGATTDNISKDDTAPAESLTTTHQDLAEGIESIHIQPSGEEPGEVSGEGHDDAGIVSTANVNAEVTATETPSQAEDTTPDGAAAAAALEESDSNSDDGWITPSNIRKRQARDDTTSSKSKAAVKHLQVATMTGDFAMQNVLLQMNLNLLSTKTCQRVSQIKQFVLRCHACFLTTRDMEKQFCSRCGKPSLTRVSCTTNDKGEVKLHLKANMQWNNRGNVYAIPKPVSGRANQKWQGPRHGGGQGGWGNDLVLAEDQKEYVRAVSSRRRAKEKDLMDEDMLPALLTGSRAEGAGRLQVGAGRNVNSRKR